MSNREGTSQVVAFPVLDPGDLAALRPLASTCHFEDGQVIVRAGEADADLLVVESGAIEILNAADENRHIVTHGPGEFTGDIDLLTGRPVIFTAVARGDTRLLRISSGRLRELLNKAPMLGEKLLVAVQERRRLLAQSGVLGLKVVGPGKCRDTMLMREFLSKNFVPFTWYDSTASEGQTLMVHWGSPKQSPVIECNDGRLLVNPWLRELADAAGVWRACPSRAVDLAVVGAGPAGMAAAIYAASEGVSTVVLDRLGPGGQAGGSSKIENFIGFPSGLSGAELATRSVLQMLKFGATMLAPVNVERIEIRSGEDEFHALHLDCGTVLRARTVLLATGVHWRKLEAEGGERFESAGIHYACTSVESILYDKQDVAVVGAGNSAGQAAMFLAECCRDRTVHMVVRRRLGPGMSDYLVGRIRATPNISLHEGVEIAAVHGEQRLQSATLRFFDPDGDLQRKAEPAAVLPLAAIFVFIGAEPGCSWLPENVARDKLGYVLTGTEALQSGQWPLSEREPCVLETTVPGLLAAGDIRSGSTKRVGFAVGDGSLAVTCVHKLTAIRN
jgi:thioredoxin reductase (NADPH)